MGRHSSSDATIKFQDIRTNIGNTNISSFQSTGQFVCTIPDLYHISVVFTSKSKKHTFQIDINKNTKVSGWIDNYYTSTSGILYYRSAAAVTATWLEMGDTVEVISDATANIGDTDTACLTIVRIN